MIRVGLDSGELFLNIKKEDLPLQDLCGFATRQNKKRGFLFVSKVLGKHYPVRPNKMKQIYDLLANKLKKEINNALMIGFAETATGLGAGVFSSCIDSGMSVKFLQTTRYNFEKEVMLTFKEEHSHAVSHIVYKPIYDISKIDTLVLVDDEMTTGKTARNFTEQFLLNVENNIKKVILVSIKNWMSCEDRELFRRKINKEIVFVSLLEGDYKFISNEKFSCPEMPKLDGNGEDKTDVILGNYGRFGLSEKINFNFDRVSLPKVKDTVLVLGTGEFSYPPYLFAKWLEEMGFNVFFQSTTRSPILVGGEIKSRMEILDNYEDEIKNFIYNVEDKIYDKIYVCYETRNGVKEIDILKNVEEIYFDKVILK